MQIQIGDKIRELRRRDGRKQEELANALGVTNQAVSRWESQTGYPDMEMIPAIANYFGVTTGYLLGEKTEWFFTSLEMVDGDFSRYAAMDRKDSPLFRHSSIITRSLMSKCV